MLKCNPETGRPWNPGSKSDDDLEEFIESNGGHLSVGVRPARGADALSISQAARFAIRPPRLRRIDRIRFFCDQNANLLRFALAPLKAAALLAWLAVFWFFWTGTPT